MKKAVIFDMDGTLWDAVDNIVISWNDALAQVGLPDVVVTRERIIGLMGRTMDEFARALLPQYEPDKGMEIMHVLERVENEYLREHGAVLLGDVEGTFRVLREREYEIGIVSNSQAGYIEAFLEHYRLGELVEDHLTFGDTGEGKAENLRRMIARGGWERFWYLGDTQGDLDACREADVPFVWASYGFGSVDAEVPRVDSLEEITEKIRVLDARAES